MLQVSQQDMTVLLKKVGSGMENGFHSYGENKHYWTFCAILPLKNNRFLKEEQLLIQSTFQKCQEYKTENSIQRQ